MSRAKIMRLAVVAALSLTAIGSAVVPAAASTTRVTAPNVPAASDTLYQCDYIIGANNIAVWRYPAGAARSGNVAYVRVAQGPNFVSDPWISSEVFAGQRWIYGELQLPAGGGIYPYYGWVGLDYLNRQYCGNITEQTSNAALTGTHSGDPFSSEPSEISAVFRGQTWVYGVDPYASQKAGWIGSEWLKRSSCNSSGCFYTITTSNIREWLYPGGASGP
jgi:hypothetical protein